MNGERLLRREWRVDWIEEHRYAVEQIERFHYAKGAPNTSTYRHALYREEGLLVGQPMGVALWIPPTKAAALTLSEDWDLSLSRLVCHPDAPKNAASFLLAASMRAIDRRRWPIFVTYADTSEGHTGAIYKATNWECLGPVPAGDVWLDASGRQVSRKRGGRTLTVADMEALGYTRKPSLPKIKFVHRVKGE